jgi:hypothetical protein
LSNSQLALHFQQFITKGLAISNKLQIGVARPELVILRQFNVTGAFFPILHGEAPKRINFLVFFKAIIMIFNRGAARLTNYRISSTFETYQ